MKLYIFLQLLYIDTHVFLFSFLLLLLLFPIHFGIVFICSRFNTVFFRSLLEYIWTKFERNVFTKYARLCEINFGVGHKEFFFRNAFKAYESTVISDFIWEYVAVVFEWMGQLTHIYEFYLSSQKLIVSERKMRKKWSISLK